jgi:alanyl-tRNA synthetase
LTKDRNIIPNDDTTNFVCSGMQQVKHRFKNPDGSKYGSLQSCVRTNDLEVVGDGVHLTSFEMLGNFQFGGNEYEKSVELWYCIMKELNFPVSYVTVHPTQENHRKMWEQRGYNTRLDDNCVWTDGEIGGYCCEIFIGDLEVGNLVNTLGHSVDVGFGWERIIQVVEGKHRVDETSLFRQDLEPIVRDHIRTLSLFWENGISPIGRGRHYICRRLLRRLLQYDLNNELFDFTEWLENEREIRQVKFVECRRALRKQKHQGKPIEWWYSTFGLTPEDLDYLKKMKYGRSDEEMGG